MTLCNNNPADLFASVAMSLAPLPELTTPAGMTMTTFQSAQFGPNGALVKTAASPRTVLDAFGVQFLAAGWKGSAPLSDGTQAMTAYSLVDKKQRHWSAVLTVRRVDGSTLAATINAVNLTDPSTKFSQIHRVNE